MVCANCKREISEAARICPFCGCPVQTGGTGNPAGAQAPYAPQTPYPPPTQYVPQQTGQAPQPPAYGYGAPQFIPGGGMPGQPPKKRTAWVVIGIVAGFLVAAGVVLASVLAWLNSPSQIFDRAMKAQDYAAAGAQLELLKGYERIEAVEEFADLANNACWDYNEGRASYEETKDLLDMLYSYCPEPDLENALDDLEVFYDSKMYFEAGKSAETAGNYPEAIWNYEQVIGEDSLYDTAQEKLEELRKQYKNQIVKKAKELADQGEYEAACDILLGGEEVLGTDSDIDELWEEYQDKAWETEMDSYGLAPSGKYKTMEAFVNSDLMQEQLDSILDEIASDGVEVQLSGQGNQLIYTFTLLEDFPGMDTAVLGVALDAALDEMGSVFESVAASLKDAVEVEDPVVVVEYVTSDGTLLCSREFRAAE